MEYYEAPDDFTQATLPGIFLAGGITDCRDWQEDAVDYLKGEPIALFNPRRRRPLVGGLAAQQEQLRWDRGAMSISKVILFWFPAGPSLQPTPILELGFWLGYWEHHRKHVLVGADPDYLWRQGLDLQMDHAGLEVEDDLCALADLALQLVSA